MIKRLLICALFFFHVFQAAGAGFTIPERRWNPEWTGGGFDYGIIDDLGTGPEYPMADCRDGNAISYNRIDWINICNGSFSLPYNPALTPRPAQQLFITDEEFNLFEKGSASIQYKDDGQVKVTGYFPDYSLFKTMWLYRKFSFPSNLLDFRKDAYVNNSTSNLVVLIHGWNPLEETNIYSASSWNDLANNILSRSPATWGLTKYDWAADAATGPKISDGLLSLAGLRNGAEAAEIGHSHGRHLGELLRLRAPQLKKVHFIAHSAGSWVARTAALYLSMNMPDVEMQITFLDPFMPADSSFGDSILGSALINSLCALQGIKRLENYYAIMDVTFGGTWQNFSWRGEPTDINCDVGIPFKYASHDGPIQYYADSVIGKVPSVIGYRNITSLGWCKSMAWSDANRLSKPLMDPQTRTGEAPIVVEIFNTNESSDYDVDIYYTTNGATPTKLSSVYSGPLYLYSTRTIKAVAYWRSNGLSTSVRSASEVASEAYTIPAVGTLPPPSIYPDSGTYSSPLDAILTAQAGDATIRYTLDGTAPTASSPAYAGMPIRLTQSKTLRAKAYKSGFTASSEKSATYKLSDLGMMPTITAVNGGNSIAGSMGRQWLVVSGSSFMPGFYALLKDETYNTEYPRIPNSRLLFDSPNKVRIEAGVGIDPALWSIRIVNPNDSASEKFFVNVNSPSIPASLAKPAFSHVSGTYAAPFAVALSSIVQGSYIRYTTDLSEPSESSQVYVMPIPVSASMTLKAKTFKYGSIPSATRTESYTVTTVKTGTLRVTIEPAATRSAGALWKVSGGGWHASGEVVDGVPVGNAVVVFNNLSGWITPLARWLTIQENQLTDDLVTYIPQNAPPLVPSNINPANGAVNISRTNAVLRWTGGDAEGSVEYAVRLGTDPNPAIYAGYGSFTGTSYRIPLTLQGGTVYYWGIRARDDQGATTDGPIWSFTPGYAYADLVPENLSVSGPVAPGSNVLVSVQVRNAGSFICSPAYIRFYLSNSAGGKALQLTSPVPATRVYDLEPGQVRTVTFSALLDGLQGGTNYIDVWIDSSVVGPLGESNFGNNLASVPIVFADANPPVVSWAQLGYGGDDIRTARTNRILYVARDDTSVKTIDFSFSTNSGTSWEVIRNGHVPQGNPLYGDVFDWLIPATVPATTNLLVKVKARDSSGNTGERIAGPYHLRDGVAPSVRILSPNGGETYDMGSDCQIRWEINAPNGLMYVAIALMRGEAIQSLLYINTNSMSSWTWKLPANQAFSSGQIRIIITDANGNRAEDWSDGFFSIRDASAPPPPPWNEAVCLTTCPSNQPLSVRAHGNPSLTVDSLGNVHMVYTYTEKTDKAPFTTRKQLLYKKRTGSLWSEPVPILSTTQFNGIVDGQYDRSMESLNIECDSNRTPHVSWLLKGGENQADVWYAKGVGGIWSAPTNISDSIRGDIDITTLSWSSKADAPVAVSRPVVAAAGGKVFLFGKPNPSDLYEYNTQNGGWTKKNAIPGGLDPQSQAVEVNGTICVLNNTDGRMKKYNPSNDSWTDGATIPSWLENPCLALAGGRIVVVGGNSTDTYAYDPSANAWSSCASRPSVRNGQMAAGLSGKVFLFGGASFEHKSSVDIYDPVSNSWSNKPFFDEINWPDLDCASVAVFSNRVYFSGRGTMNVNIASAYVWEYDPETHFWQLQEPFSKPRYFAGSCVAGGRLYVLGGTDGVNDTSYFEEGLLKRERVGTASRFPRMCQGPSNTIHVVWGDGWFYRPVPLNRISGTLTLYHRQVSAEGSWSDPVRMSSNFLGAVPAITHDFSGRLHVLVPSPLNGTNYVWHLIRTGGQWSAPIPISSKAHNWVRMVNDSQNRLHALWQYRELPGSVMGLMYSTYSNGTWAAPDVLPWGQFNSGSICVDSRNRPHLAVVASSTPNYVLYSTRNDQAWTAPLQIHRTSQFPIGPIGDAKMDLRTNEMHVAWGATLDNHGEILYNHANLSETNDVFPATVSVSRPYSGQVLSSGTPYEIRWAAYDNVGVCKASIDYSTNSGARWIAVSTNLVNTNAYVWTVPYCGSNIAYIRVSATDLSGNVGVGLSGGFTTDDRTPPAVWFDFPTTNSTWNGNSMIVLRWGATDNSSLAEVALEYALDGGKTWKEIERGLTAVTSLNWNVPDVSSTGLVFRLMARDAAGFVTIRTTTNRLSIVRVNTRPVSPYGPFPVNQATNVACEGTVLRWSGREQDGTPLTYRIRFGTNNLPPLVSSGGASLWTPPALAAGKAHYWQIVAEDGKTATTGPVWRFTTQAEQGNIRYRVTVSASPFTGGTVAGYGMFQAGREHSVSAAAKPGYAFSSWTENGRAINVSALYAFTLNGNRNLMANFMPAVEGTVQLGADEVSASENQLYALVSVSRAGGHASSASIQYKTINGSALAGQDYVAKMGTLIWAEGDNGAKKIKVRLLADLRAEPKESFRLKLFSPLGVLMGFPNTAKITILANAKTASPPDALQQALDLSEAVDNEGLVFTTKTAAPWRWQNDVTADNEDAAVSGSGGNDHSWLEVTLAEPGRLEFDWLVKGRGRTVALVFVNGEVRDSLLPGFDWKHASVSLGEGVHVVRWVFVEDPKRPLGAAYLDQVKWIPGVK